MRPMIAEPGLLCQERRHSIQPGRLCLSELPESVGPTSRAVASDEQRAMLDRANQDTAHQNAKILSASDRPGRSSATTFTQSPGWRAASRRFSSGRLPRVPLLTFSKI